MGGEVTEVIAQDLPSREKVMRFEAALIQHVRENDCAIDPESITRHWFAPGIYAREMRIPAGTVLTGKIHLHAHLNILSAGRISVLTEHGVKTLEAPCTLRSDAGIKRVGFAHTDTVWTCIHPNPDDCTDMVELERRYIAPSFEALPATEPDKLEVDR